MILRNPTDVAISNYLINVDGKSVVVNIPAGGGVYASSTDLEGRTILENYGFLEVINESGHVIGEMQKLDQAEDGTVTIGERKYYVVINPKLRNYQPTEIVPEQPAANEPVAVGPVEVEIGAPIEEPERVVEELPKQPDITVPEPVNEKGVDKDGVQWVGDGIEDDKIA